MLAPLLAPGSAQLGPVELADRLLEVAVRAEDPRPLIAAARALLSSVQRSTDADAGTPERGAG